MAKTNQTNGKAFETKLDLETLKKAVLKDKLSMPDIMKKFDVKSYTLQDKLFKLAVQDPKNAVHYCQSVPADISYKVSRKRSITIPAALLDVEGIEIGSEFVCDFKDSGQIVLNPVK